MIYVINQFITKCGKCAFNEDLKEHLFTYRNEERLGPK